MNAFQLTLSIDQDFLEKIELGLAENVIDLVSTRTSKLRGSLEIEATQQNFSNLTNEKSAKSVKRKANTPNADHVEKKTKIPAPKTSIAAPNNLPAGATMGKVTPTFGTMPDGRIICPVCTTMLKDMSTAKRHYQSSHGGVVFVCELCKAELKRKDKLKEHLMKKHELSSDTAKVITDRSCQK